MAEKIHRAKALVGEGFRFGLIGLLATLTYAIFSLLADAMGAGPYLASFAGYAMSVGISYFGHAHFTFRTQRRYRATGPRFLVVTLTMFALTNVLMFLVTDLAGQPFTIAVALVAISIPLGTWVLNRFWVFGATSGRRESGE